MSEQAAPPPPTEPGRLRMLLFWRKDTQGWWCLETRTAGKPNMELVRVRPSLGGEVFLHEVLRAVSAEITRNFGGKEERI